MANLDNFLCFGLRAVMKKIDKHLSSKLEPFGISIPQSFILLCLEAENGLTLKEIGNRTLIDSSSMTVLVDKLEKDQLVERQLDPQDRRAIRVFMTPRGEEIARSVAEEGANFNSLLYDLIGDGYQKEFIHGIKNIVNGLP